MPHRHHFISIPSQTRHLAAVRREVAAWAAEAGLDQADVDALQLAVDEACANAIEHGYAGKPDGVVEVEGLPGLGEITVVIRHRGKPFNQRLHQLTALSRMRDDRRKHGYGLHLIQRLVDEVRFRAGRRSSEVRLTKRRSGKPGAA